jgi:hypothetical protein
MRRSSDLLLGCALFAIACSDDDWRVSLPCDVRTRACQRSVFEATAAVRQQRGARPPPVRIISRAQLAEEFRSELALRQDEPEDEATIQVRKTQQGLALLGLLPSEQSFDEAYIEQAVESIAAYYSSTAQDITIIADEAEDERYATVTLSHEYVHALQDQREGLVALRREFVQTTDDDVALTSLIEGEATWLSNVTYRGAVYDEPPETIDVRLFFDSSLEATLEDIESASAPLINATELLPYALGGRYVADRYLARDVRAIEALYAAPPLTLLAWLEEPAARGVDLETLPEPLDCGTPAAPDGYELLLEDRLGFAGLLAFHVGLGQSAEDAYALALRWRSDRVSSYASTDDPDAVAITWRIRLPSASAALQLAEFVTASQSESLAAVALDQEVLVSGTSNPEVLSSWPAADDCPALDKSRRHIAPHGARVTLKERLGVVR